MRSREASDWSLLVFIEGTRLCVQLSWKCTASPESTRAPVFDSELLDLLRVHERRLVLAGHGPVVLGALDQHGRLRSQRLGPTLDDGAVGCHQPVRQRGHGIADAG